MSTTATAQEQTYKHYVGTFVDRSDTPLRWALLISYPDTEETRKHPACRVVSLGVPPVTLTTERDNALAPIVEGRLSFSLLEEKTTERYRHLFQAPEGSVSVILLRLPQSVPYHSEENLLTLPKEVYPLTGDWKQGFWRGTLDPESYKEPANQDTGYLVSFEALDLSRLKRVNLSPSLPQRNEFASRMSLRDLISELCSLSFSAWERHLFEKYRANNPEQSLTTWASEHFSSTGKDLFVDTSPLFSNDDTNYLSAYDALDRVLRPLSLSIEQSGGIWVITDLATLSSANTGRHSFSALNEDGFVTLDPQTLTPSSDDGELTALPSRGVLMLTTHGHIDSLSSTLPLANMDEFMSRWVLVPRADTRMVLPAWRYLAPKYDFVSPFYRIRTERLSTGEDRELLALVWNPKTIHGRIDGPMLSGSNHHGWSVFQVDEMGWEYSQVLRRYINRSLRAVNEQGDIAHLVSADVEAGRFRSASIASFDSYIEEEKLAEYIEKVRSYRDRLNSPLASYQGLSVEYTSWDFSLPQVASSGNSLSLRLDMPLLVSMGQDLYQELTDKTFAAIDVSSDAPNGRQWDRPNTRSRGKEMLGDLQSFTDTIIGCRIFFDLRADGERTKWLTATTRGLIWSDTPPVEENKPSLFYGSLDGENRLKWGVGWNHPNIGVEDFLGEGLHIPIPGEHFSSFKLEIYSDPHFYQRKDDSTTHYREWKLWSVPALIVIQSPAIWIADELGRKEDELAPERRERYRYTDATDEETTEDLHLSDGEGLPAICPAVIRTADGVPLKDRSPRAVNDRYSSYRLAPFRAECFGVVYGSLPERGFELTGTFRYVPEVGRRTYMGMDWITVSREVDIQEETERGTYHLLRSPESVTARRPKALAPEILSGNQSRDETYDITSPRYKEYGNRPHPPRSR